VARDAGVRAREFTREDEEQTVRFMVRPAVTTALGEYPVKRSPRVGTDTFTTGYRLWNTRTFTGASSSWQPS